MITSQNGWPVFETEDGLTHGESCGFRFLAANDDVAVIFTELVRRWVKYVGMLDLESCWSWAKRPIRGETTGYSNHASATAIDVNATDYPRGEYRMSASKIRAVRTQIVNFFGGIIRWGGDYVNAVIDQMHFEINANAAKVKAFADKLRKDDMAGIEWDTQVPLTPKDVQILTDAGAKTSKGVPFTTKDTISFGEMVRYPIELRRVESKLDNLTKVLTTLLTTLKKS